MSPMARLVIDCTEDYHTQVVDAAAARGMKYGAWVKSLIDEAMRSGPTLEDSVPSEYRPQLRMAADVLSSGDELAVTTLARSIVAFRELVSARMPRKGR